MVALSEAYHNSILISTSFYPRPSFEIGWYQEISGHFGQNGLGWENELVLDRVSKRPRSKLTFLVFYIT